MMQNQLEIKVRDAAGAIVFDLVGDLTENAEKDFDSAIKPRVSPNCRMVMNFSRVQYINSSGIALLIAFITSLQAAGGVLRVYGLTPHFQKIFEIVGLTQYLRIDPDETHALDPATA